MQSFWDIKTITSKNTPYFPLYTGGPITDINDSMSIVNERKLYSAIDSSQYVDKYKIPPKKKLSEPKEFEDEAVVNITSTFKPSSTITASLDRSRISHTQFKTITDRLQVKDVLNYIITKIETGFEMYS